MATRKGIRNSRNYVVHPRLYAFFIYVLCILKNRNFGQIVFYIALELNDYPTRCLNFGLRRIHPNGCKFVFFF